MWDAKDISEDLNVDEEPPPAPPTADGEALEKELDRIEQEESELQETPEDGIIDDDAPPAAAPEEPNEEPKVPDNEEVLPSG